MSIVGTTAAHSWSKAVVSPLSQHYGVILADPPWHLRHLFEKGQGQERGSPLRLHVARRDQIVAGG
jgi:hypothetical protein